MAEGIKYVCGKCRHTIEAWSDGNPYYIDDHGGRQYAYHPDHERLARCIGNDVPNLCLSGMQGREHRRDIRACRTSLSLLQSRHIRPRSELAGNFVTSAAFPDLHAQTKAKRYCTRMQYNTGPSSNRTTDRGLTSSFRPGGGLLECHLCRPINNTNLCLGGDARALPCLAGDTLAGRRRSHQERVDDRAPGLYGLEAVFSFCCVPLVPPVPVLP